MATKKKGGKSAKSALLSPLYSKGSGHGSLGHQEVGGPTGGKAIPDPLGFKHGKSK